jgi:hypothetical protein
MKFILVFTTLIAYSAAQQWFQPQFNYAQPQFGQMPINYGQPAFRLPYQPYPVFRRDPDSNGTQIDTPSPGIESTVNPKTAQESNSASTRLGKVAPVLMEIRGLKTEIFGNPIQDMAQFRANPPKLTDKGSDERSAKILKVLLLEELIANFLSVTPAPTTAKRTSRRAGDDDDKKQAQVVGSVTAKVGENETTKTASQKLELLFVKVGETFKINPKLLVKSPAEGQTHEGNNDQNAGKKQEIDQPTAQNSDSKVPEASKSLEERTFTADKLKIIAEALVNTPGVSIFNDKGEQVKPTKAPKEGENPSTSNHENVETYKIDASDFDTLKGQSYYVT